MSSIIFMGEVCCLYDLGFWEGGVREKESHIYTCTGGGSPVGGEFSARSILFRSGGQVGGRSIRSDPRNPSSQSSQFPRKNVLG